MIRLSLVLSLFVGLAGCQQATTPIKGDRTPDRKDFSGAWEMDYSLNDSLEAKVDRYFYGLRREMARRSQSGMGERSRNVGTPIAAKASAAIAMARFADQITRSTTLDIEQSFNDVKVEREDSFTLKCDFSQDKPTAYENPFGKEICGWDGHQLVFFLDMPDGLAVQHRLTLSSDGEQLNVATTIYTDRVTEPFTLNRAYMRYEKMPSEFSCQQTVTRGKVCTITNKKQVK